MRSATLLLSMLNAFEIKGLATPSFSDASFPFSNLFSFYYKLIADMAL
jgi:hypothetical protein